MTTVLIFEDPPRAHAGGPRSGSSALGQWLAALRDHPGQWAKFPEPMSASNGTHIRGGRRYGVEAGEFEVRTTNIDGPGRVYLYARYVGTPNPRSVTA